MTSSLRPNTQDQAKLAMLNDFRSFNTAQLTAPSASGAVMQNLENEPVSSLHADFERGLESFWKQLSALLMPNGLNGVAKKW